MTNAQEAEVDPNHHQVERLAFTVADELRTGVFAHKNALYAAINRGDIATWREGRRCIGSARRVLRQYVERKAQPA